MKSSVYVLIKSITFVSRRPHILEIILFVRKIKIKFWLWQIPSGIRRICATKINVMLS